MNVFRIAFWIMGGLLWGRLGITAQTHYTFNTEVITVPDDGIDFVPTTIHVYTDGNGHYRVEEFGTDVHRVWLQTDEEGYAVMFTFLGHQVALVETCNSQGPLCFWPAWTPQETALGIEINDGPARYRMKEVDRVALSRHEISQIDFDLPKGYVRVDRSTLAALLNDLHPH